MTLRVVMHVPAVKCHLDGGTRTFSVLAVECLKSAPFEPLWGPRHTNREEQTMDEAHGRIEFREIDEHGNALEHHLGAVEVPQRRAAVNPFIIGLWVLELALVIGIMVIINEAMAPLTPTPGNTMPFPFILMNMTPQLLQATALILATLLFWHAWQWQKRKAQGTYTATVARPGRQFGPITAKTESGVRLGV
ncbi:hypothetical protein [Arthrobacter sp. 2RAF22]|uniref:hypothetical protein n=2 Tax=unclassified Arthrobacter TaxID=235627 RepID=UPI003F8ECCA9